MCVHVYVGNFGPLRHFKCPGLGTIGSSHGIQIAENGCTFRLSPSGFSVRHQVWCVCTVHGGLQGAANAESNLELNLVAEESRAPSRGGCLFDELFHLPNTRAALATHVVEALSFLYFFCLFSFFFIEKGKSGETKKSIRASTFPARFCSPTAATPKQENKPSSDRLTTFSKLEFCWPLSVEDREELGVGCGSGANTERRFIVGTDRT